MALDPPNRLRLAELVAALSIATDLGLGQPMAHALRTCLIAISLGRALGLPAPHLVRFMAAVGMGGDIPARVRQALESPDGIGAQIAAVHCEVATMLAARLGLGSTVCDALRHAFERWDGRGFPDGWSGEKVPAPIRLAVVARDIEVLTRTRGLEETRDALQQRRD